MKPLKSALSAALLTSLFSIGCEESEPLGPGTAPEDAGGATGEDEFGGEEESITDAESDGCDLKPGDSFRWEDFCGGDIQRGVQTFSGCGQTWFEVAGEEGPAESGDHYIVVEGESNRVVYEERRDENEKTTCTSGIRPGCDDFDELPPEHDSGQNIDGLCTEHGLPLTGIQISGFENSECETSLGTLATLDSFCALGASMVYDSGCGFTWIRQNTAEGPSDTIIDSDNRIVHRAIVNPLASVPELGSCSTHSMPECKNWIDEVPNETWFAPLSEICP